MKQATTRRILSIAALAVIAVAARGDNPKRPELWPRHELEFARLIYTDRGVCPWFECWTVDQPQAEIYFTEGVSRLSRLDIGGNGVEIRLSDDTLFDYPWLYAVEVGYWLLSDYEAERLREYLLRGGFLMVDDFHGPVQWRYFIESMQRVFPERPFLDIEDGNELLHVVYDVDERIQIPGVRALMDGVTYEDGGIEPHWRGIYDDHGRLMVIANHNMDMGDGWEHADDPGYPQEMTTLALHFAVNYVIYAMTH